MHVMILYMRLCTGNRGIDAAILEEIASVTEVSGPTRVAVEAMVDFVAGVLPSATNRAVRATVKKIREQQYENLAMLMSISDESMVRAQACNTIVDKINGAAQNHLDIPLFHKDSLKAELARSRKAARSSAAATPVAAAAAAAGATAGGGGRGGAFDLAGYEGESWIREGRIGAATKGKQRVVISKVDDGTAFKHAVDVFAVRARRIGHTPQRDVICG